MKISYVFSQSLEERSSNVMVEEATLSCSDDYVLCVDFDDTKLIVGGVDGSLYVYDFERRERKRVVDLRPMFRSSRKSKGSNGESMRPSSSSWSMSAA